jgi:hypothetical protein
MTPNIGSADINIGDPNEHVAAGDGLFELASCHNHYHFRHYATYELIGANGYVWKAAKRGSACSTRIESCVFRPASEVAAVQELRRRWHPRQSGHQPRVGRHVSLLPRRPVSSSSMAGTVSPWFRPATTASGSRSIPIYGRTRRGLPLHRHARLLSPAAESDYTNNVTVVPIYIPAHPGRQGSGPLAGDTTPTVENDCHDENVKKK